MDFKTGKELLELCRRESLPISEVMRRRETEEGGLTRAEAENRMQRALEIMRNAAARPIDHPCRPWAASLAARRRNCTAMPIRGRAPAAHCSRGP